MQYVHDPKRIFNFGYEYIRSTELNDLQGTQQSNLKQITASTAWQIVSQVKFLGRYTYDLYNMHDMYTLAGFEYHTCCTALRFFWNKVWNPNLNTNRFYVHGFGLQFVFKGFAGVGIMEDQQIAAVIPGYNANITRF